MLAALPGCSTPAGSPPVMVSRADRAAGVPASAASRLDAYIAAHNSGELEAARALFAGHFAPSVLAAASAADRAATMVQTRDITGPLRLHSAQTTGTKTSALLQSEATDEWFKLELEVAPEPPSLITQASIDFADEPAGFRSAAPIGDSELAAEVREYAERLSRAGMFPGTFLVARGEQVLVKLDTRPAGGADGAAARPPQDILSVGKLFTIVAVAQLEQRGLLRLSDTVGKFLPDYPNRDVADNVTIGQLLTHTAGVPDYMSDPAYRAARSAAQGRSIPTTSGYLPFFADLPLEFRPGTRRSYSNSGYVVVARIIEAITGSPFADYVALRILAPAGMSSTSAATVRAAGGEHSTVEDLCAFGRALQQGRLLSEAQTRLILSPVVVSGTATNAYGVETWTEGGVSGFGHGGGAPGMSSRLEFYPRSGHCMAVVAAEDAAARRLTTRVRRLIGRVAQ